MHACCSNQCLVGKAKFCGPSVKHKTDKQKEACMCVTGLAGLVGMVRNWMFTAFYCSAELWGDVVLSLLFWGLANEMTNIEEAPVLYPLFGIGANVRLCKRCSIEANS